ncbi:TIR domain-containing protein [Lentzea sp. NPDC004789]
MPADEGSYDFFVSHSPADQDWASWIAWQLEERLRLDGRQPKAFLRAWDVVSGRHDAISTHLAIKASARLVAVLTPDYLANAENGMEELLAMWSGDRQGLLRRVVPVRVKACTPDGLLASIVPLDLVGRDETESADALLTGIVASLHGRAKPMEEPPFPETPSPGKRATPRFPGPVLVGEPPTIPPRWFRDRIAEVHDIELHLADPRTGLVTVVGHRDGLGKTALIHRIWERVREGSSPLRAYGLVYLSARGFRPVTAGRVIDALVELLPAHEAERLKAVALQPLPAVEKLVEVLDALAGRTVILAIDAIEELLDDDENIADPALRELINHLVPRPESGVRLLLVGRRAMAERFPATTQRRDLERGLPPEEAFALLEVMDVDGTLNLGAVPEHDRARLHRLTRGSPRALELVYAVLAHRDCSFAELLDHIGQAEEPEVILPLLTLACRRLPPLERSVLQALAVYGRPVPAAAVEHLVPDREARGALEGLRRLRLAQQEGMYFSVPAPAERDFLIGLVGPETSRTREVLLHLAADYFAGERHREPTRFTDLRPQLLEIELRLRAGDRTRAFALMAVVDDEYLRGWGASSALVPLLRMLLRGDGNTRLLEIDAESLLARALMQEEDHRGAVEGLEHALGLASRGHARRRIVLREQLTEAYLQLGELRLAAAHNRRACLASITQIRPRHAVTAIAGLAVCLARQGRFGPALRRFRSARTMLALFGKTADRVHRPTILISEAWVHIQLGARDRARALLREAKRDAIALGDRDEEGSCLLNEAQLALDDHNLEHAVSLAEEASAIGVHNGDYPLCRLAMEILAMAKLDQGDLPAATRAAAIAQRNRGSVLGYVLVGLAAYRRHDADDEARAAFHQGRVAASKRHRLNERDFQFLDTCGLVACGLALLGEQSFLATALDSFRTAREITNGAGAVTRILFLLKQFEPRADPRTLERVRSAAKGERVQPKD